MREFINLCKITKTVDTTKLITGILIIVFFIVKTIIGDAKKEQESNTTQQPPKRPKTVFPEFFNDDEPQKEPIKAQKYSSTSIPTEEGMSVTAHMATQSQMASNDLDEEQLQAHAERWRQAVIDSEILKTKF